jgi:glyoxylase-like metal-dependent hydrolase (beta-lactamase superfamily II)
MLPTGSMQSSAGLAFRGGSFAEEREFVMTGILVRHPRGNLLFDAGFGHRVDEHAQRLPLLMRAFTTYTKGTPVGMQLTAHSVPLSDLAGVVLTHAHWDHVSGLDTLFDVPVWVTAAEREFIDHGGPITDLMRSFGSTKYKVYDIEGGPYLDFPRSHDVWGDGSVVLVPAPGHTPGSIVAFIALPSGARYALLGDLVWQLEGIELPAERPWLARSLIGEDAAAVRESIARVAAIHRRFPEIVIVPAHDARVAAKLPVFPAVAE